MLKYVKNKILYFLQKKSFLYLNQPLRCHILRGFSGFLSDTSHQVYTFGKFKRSELAVKRSRYIMPQIWTQKVYKRNHLYTYNEIKWFILYNNYIACSFMTMYFLKYALDNTFTKILHFCAFYLYLLTYIYNNQYKFGCFPHF